jgi:hypothetical protein
MTMSFERAASRRITAAAVLVALLAAQAPALAATPEDRAAAREHQAQAQEAKKQGQLAEACNHLAEVERLDPKLPTLLELADCTEQLGMLVEAQALWAAARDRAKQTEKPQSRAKAEERLAAVEKRVARLTLQLAPGAPQGAQVLRDDVALEASSLGVALPMNPGDHVVVVKASGHDDAKYSVKLAEGDAQTLDIAVGPAIVAAAPPPPPPPPKVVAAPVKQEADVAHGSGSGQRTVGMIMGATGIVSVGVGAPLWFIGYRDGNSLGPTADQQLLAGQILVIGGGVLLATGAVLFLTAPSRKSSQAGLPVTPSLVVGRNATLVGASGQF